MATGKAGAAAWIAVAFVQVLASQIVTFVASFLVPAVIGGLDMEKPQAAPVAFVLVIGITMGLGEWIVGALAAWRGLLPRGAQLGTRTLLLLAGMAVPLALAVLLGQVYAGSPFFLAAILLGIAGFQSPNWFGGDRGRGEPSAMNEDAA